MMVFPYILSVSNEFQLPDEVRERLAQNFSESGAPEKTALDAAYGARRVEDVLTRGAAADGSVSGSGTAVVDWTAFTAARTAAGAFGIVHFPAKPGAAQTVYYFDTATATETPDLSGCYITADPGVVISVDNVSHVDYRAWKLLTPVSIYVRSRTSYYQQRPNRETDPNVRIGNADLDADFSTRTAEDFHDWTIRDYTPDGTFAYSAATPAIPASPARQMVIAPSTGVAGHTYSGHTTLGVGEAIRLAIGVTTGVTNGATLVQVDATNEFVQWMIPDNLAALSDVTRKRRLSSSGARTDELTISLPSRAYSTQTASKVLLEVKRTGLREAELWINGAYFDRTTFSTDIVDVGFGANYLYAAQAPTLYDAVRVKRSHNAGGRILRLAVLGDSISFGAASSTGWVDVLADMLRGAPGVSDVIVTNYAHSGDKVAAQKTVASGVDFTAFDYALVLIGTNDIQSQTSITTFNSDLATLIGYITAGGCTPIIGTPPMFIASSVTGYGLATTNYALGARYRAAVEYFAASSGYGVADVLAEIGRVGADNTTMFDNLHPTLLGTQAIARAFAKALLRDLRSHWAIRQAAVHTDVLGIGNSVAATTLGSLAKKIEVFDVNGASIGFVPVYDAIT
jgi:lysophospholipase L1-like esterase